MIIIITTIKIIIKTVCYCNVTYAFQSPVGQMVRSGGSGFESSCSHLIIIIITIIMIIILTIIIIQVCWFALIIIVEKLTMY